MFFSTTAHTDHSATRCDHFWSEVKGQSNVYQHWTAQGFLFMALMANQGSKAPSSSTAGPWLEQIQLQHRELSRALFHLDKEEGPDKEFALHMLQHFTLALHMRSMQPQGASSCQLTRSSHYHQWHNNSMAWLETISRLSHHPNLQSTSSTYYLASSDLFTRWTAAVCQYSLQPTTVGHLVEFHTIHMEMAQWLVHAARASWIHLCIPHAHDTPFALEHLDRELFDVLV